MCFSLFFVLSDTTLSSWPGIAAIFQVKSVLFYCKERYCVTAYRLESSQARFKKCRLLFYNYGVFARVQIKNGNILLLLSSLLEPKVHIKPKVACKTSKFVTKETSLLLPQTPWQSMR